MSDTPAIDARDLRRTFRDVVAVDGVTLTIPRGAIFGLVGPDGAGKSTLIRLLATVLEPTSGDASVFGHSVTRDAQAVKARIGYMSQRFSLYGDLTVAENLSFFAELRGVPRAERTQRAKKLLEFSGLTEFSKRQARNLSGGMKQKLALAATLIHEPDLLFLDEPTTGVDPVSRREFWRIISGLHRRGITVLVATPYMDEAERCTEVAFMDAGRILLRDTPDGIKRRVAGRLVEITVDDNRRAAALLTAMEHVIGVEPYGDALYVLLDCDQPCEEALERGLTDAGIDVGGMSPAPMTMEVAFSRLISGSSVAPVSGSAS